LYNLSRPSSQLLESEESQLTVKIFPRLSGLVGIVFGGITLIFLLATLRISLTTQLNCERLLNNTITCQLIESSVSNKEIRKKLFSGLHGSKIEVVEDEYDNRESTTRYNLILATDLDNIAFSHLNVYTKNYKLDELYVIKSKIDIFLKNSSQQTLNILEDSSESVAAGFYITVFFSFMTAVILALGTVVECKFDKHDNTMILSRWKYWRIFGDDKIQHTLSEIKDIKLEDADAEEGSVYRIVFILNQGEIIPLNQIYTSEYLDKRKLIKRIKDFLNLPIL
jgi:hypothetical protein